MALNNPRFQGNRDLQQVVGSNKYIRKGHSSDGLHYLQMALLDAGYLMPRSTGGSGRSPDGVFGNETDGIVREFQRKNRLSDDGIIGPNTMRAMDRILPKYTHRVALHFRSISLTNAGFAKMLSEAQRIYRPYGLRVVFGSGESLNLTPQQSSKFERIDTQCNWDMSTGEYAELQELGSRVPVGGISVYFVKRMVGVVGCGGHIPGRPSCAVGSRAASIDVAHEVGHVLLTKNFSPVHHPHRRNIMHASTTPGVQNWLITDRQIRQMRLHSHCQSI